MAEKIPFVLLSQEQMGWLGRRFRGIGSILAKANPSLEATLAKLKLDIEPAAYAMGSFVSAFFYALLLFILTFVIMGIKTTPDEAFRPALAIGLSIWVMFFGLHIIYPGILMRKIAAKEGRDLLFALREMMIDVDGGVPLFDAMKNVSLADYGYVSRDLGWVVRQIEGGVSERSAMRELAVRTESEYMKRALWQTVNALDSGSSVTGALASIVQSVESYIYRDIKNYSSELNFIMLIYMMGAAVVPSLGITFLVLLSAFSGLGVSFNTLIMLVGASAALQVVMIGYMSSTRPEVFGG